MDVMNLIKPPKKKRLIASWRAYKRWYDEINSEVIFIPESQNDGSYDVYAYYEKSNLKRYVGSFRTTSVSDIK